MITAIERQAETISLSGAEAGRAIWLAVDCAIEAGLPANRARRVFDSMLDAIVDDMPADASELFSASAYEAIPAVALSAVERAEINANAWRAYEVFVGDARSSEDDYRYEQMRDERMMERA
jgi:hypothetical protein